MIGLVLFVQSWSSVLGLYCSGTSPLLIKAHFCVYVRSSLRKLTCAVFVWLIMYVNDIAYSLGIL